MVKMKKNTVCEFGKAQVSSFVATLVDFAVTSLLFQIFGLYYVYSTFVGALAGGLTNCVVNHKWTFRGNNRSKRSVAFRYLFVWCGSIALNTWGTAAGVRLVSEWESAGLDTLLIVKAVVAVIVAVFWNFLMQKYYVYRKGKRKSEEFVSVRRNAK